MKITKNLLFSCMIVLVAHLVLAQIPSVGITVEGDFNGDGKKEFAFPVKTFEGEGNPVDDGMIKTFLVPTGGNYLGDQQILNIIFKENGIVYYFEIDENDENFKLIQKKAILEN